MDSDILTEFLADVELALSKCYVPFVKAWT